MYMYADFMYILGSGIRGSSPTHTHVVVTFSDHIAIFVFSLVLLPMLVASVAPTMC